MQFMIKQLSNVLDKQFIQKALSSTTYDQKCSQLHAVNCNQKAIITFVSNFKSLFKLYFTVHLVPLLLFKLKRLKKNPSQQLAKFAKGLLLSLIFAAGTTAVARRLTCLFATYSSFDWTCAAYSPLLSGGLLLFESTTRQIQISLYALAKGWQAGFLILKRRKYRVRVPCGNLLITATALGIICKIFLDSPELFRDFYRNILGKILNDI